MWTCENHPKYNRDKLRYPSDLTDEEWSHVAPLIRPAKHGGGKRKIDVGGVVNGIMYVLSTGCQWRRGRRRHRRDLPPYRGRRGRVVARSAQSGRGSSTQ